MGAARALRSSILRQGRVFGGSECQKETVGQGFHHGLDAALQRQRGDIVVAQVMPAAAQGDAQQLDQIAARETAAGKARRERLQVGGPESFFQFGEGAEREAERIALTAELESDLAAS